jgi:hypothetical protein
MRLLLGLYGFLVLFAVLGGCERNFDLQLDKKDTIIYITGGGELGAPWTEVAFSGDGAVNYRYIHALEHNQAQRETTAKYQLFAEDTRDLFQSLIDIGFFDLKNNTVLGADIPRTMITASIDGANHQVSWSLIKESDRQYIAINELIRDTLIRLGIKKP